MPIPNQLNMHGKVALVAELAHRVPAERRASIRKCSFCSEQVGLTSGSEMFIRKHGLAKVVIVCANCVSEPVMDKIKEFAATKPHQAANNEVPSEIIQQIPADTLAKVLEEAQRKDDNRPLPITPDQICDSDHPDVQAIVGCIVTDIWIMAESRGILAILHRPGDPDDDHVGLAVDSVTTSAGPALRIRIGGGNPHADLKFMDQYKCPMLVGSTFTGIDGGSVVLFGKWAIRFVTDGIEVCTVVEETGDLSVN